MNFYKRIFEDAEYKRKRLAVLIDPEQCRGSVLAATVAALKTSVPDYIFLGGSHTAGASLDSLIDLLKEEVNAPVILFPGNVGQFSKHADALLFLSLLSGRNAEYLIGQHVCSALSIRDSGIEVIPTGYLLIEGGKLSSVEYISDTRPIPSDKVQIALSTAVAGELLGMKLIYLEAGSGAMFPVQREMIERVSEQLSIPLIVGGGIKKPKQMCMAFDAGADIVVVGNVFERYPSLITEFVLAVAEYNLSQIF